MESKRIEYCQYCNSDYCRNCSDAEHRDDFCSRVCEDAYYEESSESQEESYPDYPLAEE